MFLILQAIVAILLIIFILLQERSSGLSGILGGSESASYQTRRGLEKFIFYGTIVLAVVFIGLALLRLVF
ncbi:preprotein translocase subunit SecG [Candidatus Jorgensenbacteria bacterium RIFCSPLOWO2_12_FULL_42_11]|uniref:Protein-export membrane protein SecG n=1 Tax=Candidatus Jorgensenbacteria bacterium RIFCSPLOWO2_12_FULL_42_11 TaxID=1798473 RepID=A0A1F6C256_9BACT|nr:MAG: preprotein translocase subunit SecG [Candidatus Jorgensenbacteria bacterium RIFCSPLOWO2_12_FULL_42_11]